jgi:hypothetical protein
VYDHLRAGYQALLAAKTQEQAAAQQRVAAARTAVNTANANLATANTAQAGARAALPAAQHSVDTAQRDVTLKSQAVASAQAAVTDWEGQEPDPYLGGAPIGRRETMLPGGGYQRPNPAHTIWQRKLTTLRAALATANTALATANATLGTARANLATANQRVASAQASVDARTRDVGVAPAAVTGAQAAVDAAAATVTTIRAQIAALDARTARLQAAPLDREDLSRLAEEEQAEVTRLRRVRHDVRQDRHAASTDRARLLHDHDAAVASLVPLAAALRGWSGAAYTEPPQAAAVLDSLVAAAAAQAASTPRHDDLTALTGQVQAALRRLQTGVDAATTDRDDKLRTLQDARDAVAQALAEQP